MITLPVQVQLVLHRGTTVSSVNLILYENIHNNKASSADWRAQCEPTYCKELLCIELKTVPLLSIHHGTGQVATQFAEQKYSQALKVSRLLPLAVNVL